MTIALAVKVPRACVLAVDSRITTNTGTISSNGAEKWLVIGGCVCLMSGSLGGSQDCLRKWLAEECTSVDELIANRHGSDWGALIYDRTQKALILLDADGSVVECDGWGVVGSGEDIAYGFLAASRRPRTATQARRMLSEAIAVCATRNIACGGRIRTFVVPDKGKIQIR